MHFPLAVHDISMHRINSSTVKKNFASKWDIIQLFEGILILVINSALFCIIVSAKSLRKKIPNQFYLNLQAIHILVSVLIISAEFTNTTWQEFAYLVIAANALLMSLFVSLMISTCDRFLAVKYPFMHANVKSKHVTYIVLCSWIPPVIFIIFSVKFEISQHQLAIISATLIAMATVILSISNVTIYYIAKKHEKFLAENSRQRIRKNKTIKASYACFAVVFSFVCSWTPFLIHSLMALAHVYKPSSKSVFTLFVEQFALLSFLIDPILLIAFSNDIRKKIKSKCSRKSIYDVGNDSRVQSTTL